jgi:hypothetical protein
MMRGNYRPSRHGPRPRPPEEQAKADAWAALRLPGISPPRPFFLIEELLQRERIEILPEDRSHATNRDARTFPAISGSPATG